MIEHFKDPKKVTRPEFISAPPGCLFWVDEPDYVGRWLAVTGPHGFVIMRGHGLGELGETRLSHDVRHEIGDLMGKNPLIRLEYAGNIHHEKPIEIANRLSFFGVKPAEDSIFYALLCIIHETKDLVMQ
jgi:hypothetical protein